MYPPITPALRAFDYLDFSEADELTLEALQRVALQNHSLFAAQAEFAAQSRRCCASGVLCRQLSARFRVLSIGDGSMRSLAGTVGQDGSIKLSGKSFQSNQPFTGSGKMNNDGSLGITLGNVSTGATFQGSINPKSGALYGTWKNAALAGNFSGSKQGQEGSPLEAIGGLLDGLGKVLGQQH